MTNAPDTLAITRQLEADHGLEREHAAATVTAVQALTTHLASKADLEALRGELRGEMQALAREQLKWMASGFLALGALLLGVAALLVAVLLSGAA